jgi:hypothetical protein
METCDRWKPVITEGEEIPLRFSCSGEGRAEISFFQGTDNKLISFGLQKKLRNESH